MNGNLVYPVQERARERLDIVTKALRDRVLAIPEIAQLIGTSDNQARRYISALMGEEGEPKRIYIADWAAKGKNIVRLVPCYRWRQGQEADMPKPLSAANARRVAEGIRPLLTEPPPPPAEKKYTDDPLLAALYGRSA